MPSHRMKVYSLKYILTVIVLLAATVDVFSQLPGLGNRRFGGSTGQQTETKRGDLRKQKKALEKPDITLYKIISHSYDTTYVDTSLTIFKDYKLNYKRKDNFELLEFPNIGQPYNELAYDFNRADAFPSMGFKTKHQNYLEIEDINYYEVPTPFSDLMYKSVFEQGQILDALITLNTSRRFNFSIAYKGLRSLGTFQHIESSNGLFRFTFNYRTKSNRYKARFHFVAHDFKLEENGGLTPQGLLDFEGDTPQFQDRGRLPVNFQDAESFIDGKRGYFEQEYALYNVKKDSLKIGGFKIGHVFKAEGKFYKFDQDQANAFFGNSFTPVVKDRVDQNEVVNQFSIAYDHPKYGYLKGKISHTNYFYGYNSVVFFEDRTIKNELKGDIISAGGEWKKRFGKIDLKADALLNITGDYDGNYLKAEAAYAIDSLSVVNASFLTNSKAPDFTAQLFQSDYMFYNWENDFSNTKTQNLTLSLTSKKWADVSVSATRIQDYIYYANTTDEENVQLVRPFQAGEDISYIKIKAFKEFKYWKLALANTLLYQNVSQGEQFLRVPDFISRNTFYYTDKVFKKALFLQTGFTVNYFSDYFANEYNPILGEFFIQDKKEIGFPRLDFFINFKVRQARIFFKYENVSPSTDGFSSPTNPFRDTKLRFGIVWNFFS